MSPAATVTAATTMTTRSTSTSATTTTILRGLSSDSIQDEEDDDKRTYMARLIIRLDTNLRLLGVNTESDDVLMQMERMAILIHESMSISSRNYHSVQHVFDISQDIRDPICVLAALFHDCIYYHVDGGFSQRQLSILNGIVEPNETGCQLIIPPKPNDPSNDDENDNQLMLMVISIFGYDKIHGQQLTPFTGVNEFLSAIIAVQELKSLLSKDILAQISCCIEATIPFRSPDKDTGLKPIDQLYNRMKIVNEEYELQMSPEEIITCVQRAVLLGNNDVGNFATEDEAYFLDNTWSLLPESNVALRHKYLYTVQEFQYAVYKMYQFFTYFLKPTIIFQQFNNVPTDQQLRQLQNCAQRNIEIGRKYIGAKLLSISVLSAFAELTGGDAPISLFMGDLPSRDRVGVENRIDSSLPRYNPQDLQDCDCDVYQLLSDGRKSESAFDVKQSPLAAYLYAYLGDSGLERILKDEQTYPMNVTTARDLLSHLPRPSVMVVAENIAKVAKSRSDRIFEVIESLPPPEEVPKE